MRDAAGGVEEGDRDTGHRRQPGHEARVDRLGRGDRAQVGAGPVAQPDPRGERADRPSGWVVGGAVPPGPGRGAGGGVEDSAGHVADQHGGGQAPAHHLTGRVGPPGLVGDEGDRVGRRAQLLAEGIDRGTHARRGQPEPFRRAAAVDGRHGRADEERAEQDRAEYHREEGCRQPPA